MSPLRRYISKRLMFLLPTLIGVSIIGFLLVHLIPGDPATILLGTRYTEERASEIRQEYGLDLPLPLQYGLWLKRVGSGDLGTSSTTGQPVTELLSERIPVTLSLVLWSLLLALVLSIPIGMLAAIHRGKPVDQAASVLGLAGLSIPNFWLGTLLILIFSLITGWFPSGGYAAVSDGVLTHLRHLFLPMLALGGAVAAVLLRTTRSAMLEVLDQDYMTLAKAKGVPPVRLLVRHGLRNALVPILTVLGIQTGYLLGGSIVIEEVFSLPGLGQLTLRAVQNRDIAVIQGCLILIASTFAVTTLLVDLSLLILFPKVRQQEEAA